MKAIHPSLRKSVMVVMNFVSAITLLRGPQNDFNFPRGPWMIPGTALEATNYKKISHHEPSWPEPSVTITPHHSVLKANILVYLSEF